MPTVRGSQYKSFKTLSPGDWIFVAWWDDPYKLLPVRGVEEKYITVETPHGGILEITNPEACWEALAQ